MKTLLFAYGNADREDDGVSWHVLCEIMRRNSLPVSDDLDIEFSDPVGEVMYIFQMQLTPEIAADLRQYDRACFIDAHTGAVPEDVHFEIITPSFQKSPFTHHLTVGSLLSIAETMNRKIPETILVSVRGYQFGFSRELSPATTLLTSQAADIICHWMNEKESSD